MSPIEKPDIADAFVSLALNRVWSGVKELPEAQEKILFETVIAAGHEAKTVMPGRLYGGVYGDIYEINSTCPYKVVHKNKGDDRFATGWLDSLLQLVRRWRHEGHKKVVEAVRIEIERSIPFRPIQLTAGGDMLREYPPALPRGKYLVEHTRDEHRLVANVGMHVDCGFVNHIKDTETQENFLFCKQCCLKIAFPNTVKTFGELREFLLSTICTSC